MRKVIHTLDAPAPIGAYSQAIFVTPHLFISGQIPIDPNTDDLIGTDIQAQTRQVFENMKAILRAADANFADIVKLQVYLIDINAHFAVLNEVMAEYFNEPYPTRAVIEVSRLPKDALVEVVAEAILPH